MPPTAPGLLSGWMVQPLAAAISLAIRRMTMSVPPPAAYMMTMVIGLSGHLPAAFALRGIVMAKADIAAAPPRKSRRRIENFFSS